MAHERHHQLAAPARRFVLLRVFGRDGVQPAGRDAKKLEGCGHRVGRELAAAGTRAGAGDVLDLIQLFEVDLARPIGTDGLEDGHHSGVALALVDARIDRAVVESESRDVEARHRHRRARHRLVAAHQTDQAVEQVAAADELDRIRDHLAADERGFHALRAHGHAVRDGDRVELHRCAAGGTDALLDVFRQTSLVVVAGHGLDPRRGNADERLGEVLVRETDRLEHGPGGRSIRAVGQSGGVALGRVGRPVVGQIGHVVGNLTGDGHAPRSLTGPRCREGV